ncbi:MAG: Ig-like domain-containing protein [Mycolicibacterium sp.]|uniref:Ig-like domain-containing protein n=1 Tax=Mycolicibacterium sp. TaxID=2320850 RepID=UPI003D12C06A
MPAVTPVSDGVMIGGIAQALVPAGQSAQSHESESIAKRSARQLASAKAVTALVPVNASAIVRAAGAESGALGASTGQLPLQNLFAGLFEFVRRTFFNTAPTAAPIQFAQLQGPVVIGSLGVTDAEGDRLAYRVTGQPTRGTVAVDSDGSYTYTPSNPGEPGTSGTDSFVISLRDRGFHINLLDWFRPRVTTVKVDVSWTNGTTDGTVGETDQVVFKVLNATSHRLKYQPVGGDLNKLGAGSPYAGEYFEIGETAEIPVGHVEGEDGVNLSVSFFSGFYDYMIGLNTRFNDLNYRTEGNVTGCDSVGGVGACLWHGNQPAFDQYTVVLIDDQVHTVDVVDHDRQAALVDLCSDGGAASAGCRYDLKKVVTNVKMNAAGSGYTSAPEVLLMGGVNNGGDQGTATAYLNVDKDGNPTDKVGHVTIDNQGYDYGDEPTVVFKGGGGTGAQATAVIGEVGIELRAPRLVASSPYNPNSEGNQPYTATWSNTVSSSDSVGVGIKVSTKFKVFEVEVNTEISTTYTHTWGESSTFTESFSVSVPPNSIGYIYKADAVYRYFGDLTIPLGVTTWVLRNVWFDAPPNSGDQYTGVVYVKYEPCDSNDHCAPPPDTLTTTEISTAATTGVPLVQDSNGEEPTSGTTIGAGSA